VAAGEWPRAALGNGRETAGQTLGIIGFGSIGQTTARLARGLGMQVIAYDAMLEPDAPLFTQAGVRYAGWTNSSAMRMPSHCTCPWLIRRAGCSTRRALAK
jgi:D-arabinose 1-dehydrogenase-like Zn-dependent alcohol dehydrogenase